MRLSHDLVHARTLAPGLTEMMDLRRGRPRRRPHPRGAREGEHWMQAGPGCAEMEFGTAQRLLQRGRRKSLRIRRPGTISDAHGAGDAARASAGRSRASRPGTTSSTWSTIAASIPRRPISSATCGTARSRLLNAENYASLAWLDGQTYPADELTEAWKKITLNQFHDLAAGSGIAVIYNDAQKDFDQVRWATA